MSIHTLLRSPLAALLLATTAVAGDPGVTPTHVHLPAWQPEFFSNEAYFGHDVALEGHLAAVAAIDPRVVVTYEQIGGLWTESQVLTSPVGDGDGFGTSIALHGGRLFVGAARDDVQDEDAGALHVYERVDGTWTLVQTLRDDTPTWHGRFGSLVVADGEWLGVAASQDAPSGSIHVFIDGENGYERVDVLTNGFVDVFGYDFTLRARPGESTVDVIAGDFLSDVIAPHGGAVWPYVVTLDNTLLYGPIFPADLDAGDFFGSAVAIDGDQLFVGASSDDERAADAGAVYVFDIDWDGVAPTFDEVHKLMPTDGDIGERFGSEVLVADGRLVISGDTGFGETDTAYLDVYRPALFGNGWTLDDRLTAADWQAGDAFAQAIAMDAGRVLVGAHTKHGAAHKQGAAYMFSTLPKTETSGFSPSPYLSQTETYGTGKPGTLGVPVLSATTPAVPGQTLLIGVSNLVQGSMPVLFWGPQRAELPFDGGALLVGNPIITKLPAVGQFGQVGVGGTVPDDLALCGIAIHMQAMFVDPGAAGAKQTAHTNGLTVIVGY